MKKSIVMYVFLDNNGYLLKQLPSVISSWSQLCLYPSQFHSYMPTAAVKDWTVRQVRYNARGQVLLP